MTWPSTLANRVSSRPLRLDEAPFLWAISALLVLLRARPAAAGGRLGLAVLRPARLGLGVRGLGLGAGLGSGAAGGLRVGVLVLGGAGGRLRLGGGLGPAWRVDDVHPDPGQRLAVALVAALAGLVLVGEHAQLVAPVLVEDRGGDLGADELARPGAHLALVVDHEQRDELDAVAVAADPLHVDDVTDLDLVLLSAGADDGVHVSTVLSVLQRETAASHNRRVRTPIAKGRPPARGASNPRSRG